MWVNIIMDLIMEYIKQNNIYVVMVIVSLSPNMLFLLENYILQSNGTNKIYCKI